MGKHQSDWDAPQPTVPPIPHGGFKGSDDFTMTRMCDNGADLDVATGTFSNQYDRTAT